MLSYWVPALVALWWPLAFAIVSAIGAVIAVSARVARRAVERIADRITAIYGVNFGLADVSEFVLYLAFAGIWSLSTSTVAMNVITIVVVVVAVVALIAGAVLELQESVAIRWRIRPTDEPMLSHLSHNGGRLCD